MQRQNHQNPQSNEGVNGEGKPRRPPLMFERYNDYSVGNMLIVREYRPVKAIRPDFRFMVFRTQSQNVEMEVDDGAGGKRVIPCMEEFAVYSGRVERDAQRIEDLDIDALYSTLKMIQESHRKAVETYDVQRRKQNPHYKPREAGPEPTEHFHVHEPVVQGDVRIATRIVIPPRVARQVQRSVAAQAVQAMPSARPEKAIALRLPVDYFDRLRSDLSW